MCRLIVGINSVKDNTTYEKIIKDQLNELNTQKDGAAALVVTNDNEIEVKRELKTKNYDDVYDFALKQADTAKFIGLHTRTNTWGETSERNVHFFCDDGMYMAHNGSVFEYRASTIRTTKGYHWKSRRNSGSKSKTRSKKKSKQLTIEGYDNNQFNTAQEELDSLWDTINGCTKCYRGKQKRACSKHKSVGKRINKLLAQGEIVEVEEVNYKYNDNEDTGACDSLQFLQDLERPLSKQYLESMKEEKSFKGIATIIDEETLKAYLIVAKQSYVLTDEENFATYHSHSPNVCSKKIDLVADIFNVEYNWGERKKGVDVPKRELEKGVYEIDLKEVEVEENEQFQECIIKEDVRSK